MNRNRLIVGIIVLIVILILIISGSMILFGEWKSRQARVDYRIPPISLGYCSSQQLKPCILSFNADRDGSMLINVLTDHSSPDFYLKIKSNETENIYNCQKTEEFSASMTCKGKVMPLGVIFQFLIISTNEDNLLAEGHFPVIGLALATPEIFLTPTPNPFLKHYR